MPKGLTRGDLQLCKSVRIIIGMVSGFKSEWCPASSRNARPVSIGICTQLRVIVTVRPKYACRAYTNGVTQVPAPAHLIEGGLPTEGAIAHVLVSKYADHLPLHRQSQILARSGIDIHRGTLADWVGTAAFHLAPVVDRLAEHLKVSTKLFMDETTAPVLDPGRGKTKTGYLWALARDDRAWSGDVPPGVVFFYAPDRRGENAEKILRGFDGVLQLDG